MPQPTPPPYLAGRSSMFSYGCPKPVAYPMSRTANNSVATTKQAQASRPGNQGWDQ